MSSSGCQLGWRELVCVFNPAQRVFAPPESRRISTSPEVESETPRLNQKKTAPAGELGCSGTVPGNAPRGLVGSKT